MLLAVDTSTRYLGVALYDGIRVISEVAWLSQDHHTVELAPIVDETLRRAQVENKALKAVAVATGPGSFTGLRIGLAFAKGMAFSRKIPLVGIPTLNILAASQPVTNVTLAGVLEAGRRRLAVGWYQAEAGRWISIGSLENLTMEDFVDRLQAPATVCGELNQALRREITSRHDDIFIASPSLSLRRPAFLAELAWNRLKTGRGDDPAALKPIYLHHGEPIPG
jgi:tRNA threonylcarbamoyladenosine biosynthesis protein TsaB